MSTTTTELRGNHAGRRVLIRGIAAVVVSAVANAVLLAAVLESGAVQPFSELAYPRVVVLSALGAAAATIVYWFIAQRRANPDRLFVLVALVALVLSFVPDIGLLATRPDATVPGVVVLMAMHVVVAAVCIALLTERGS